MILFPKNSRKILLAVLGLIFLTLAGFSLIIYHWLQRPVYPPGSKTRHLIVISIDALNAQDFNEINTLPVFKQLLAQGSYIKEVISVYPSLTYPAHTSIITGVYPLEHGIIANNINQPGVKLPDWYWYHKYIRVPTLYDIARIYKLKTAILFWPVNAGARVDYNLPEIWPTHSGQNMVLLALQNGNPWYIMDLYLRYGKLLKEGASNLDNFTTAVWPIMVSLHLNPVIVPSS
jgi:hypothetical protein